MGSAKPIKLGAWIHGVGAGWEDWRHPDALTDASTNVHFYKKQAQIAEAAKFDFVFIADSMYIDKNSSPHYLNRFEPLTILSAIAAVTKHVGLVATATVTYSEPFNLARQLASLDHISKGRAGWNVVTSWLSGTAENFSRREHLNHDTRYRLAQEFLDVVKGLWDSYEDDAFIVDKANGRFLDPSKLHELNHKGEFLSVKGPLNIARSPQGHPVIFQAGASENGRNFAARNAEAIFVHYSSLEENRAYYSDVKRRAVQFGRSEDEIFILPGISPIVGRTQEEAEAKYRQKLSLVSVEKAVVALSRPFDHYDFTKHNLDDPFPDLGELGYHSHRSSAEKIKEMARKENLTLREVALRHATPRGDFVGTAEEVADRIQEAVEKRAADGFIVGESLPGELENFTKQVVPILRERGLFREEYEHDTFRGNLGLKKPVNRYTAQLTV